MPKLHKVGTAGVTLASRGENLFRLQVKEAKPHRAISHDAFQVSPPPAAAEMLLGIEGDDGMPSFPDTFCPRISSKADSFAQGPDSNDPVEMPTSGGDSRRHHVGVVEDPDRHLSIVVLQHGRQEELEIQPL